MLYSFLPTFAFPIFFSQAYNVDVNHLKSMYMLTSYGHIKNPK